MSIEEFVQLVENLRAAQKNYFKTRQYSAMLEAKRLEGLVDQALKDGVIVPVLDSKEDGPGLGEQIGMFE